MKFHYSDIKNIFKLIIMYFVNSIVYALCATVIYLTLLVFLPVYLISVGPIKKLTKPILNFRDTIISYLMKKMINILSNI